MTEREILGHCFISDAPLWNQFIGESGKLNILYYPSAGKEHEIFEYCSSSHCRSLYSDIKYDEPDLFLFSDYFEDLTYLFNNGKMCGSKNYTILEMCELKPADHFQIYCNTQYAIFNAGPSFGKAIFFKVKINGYLDDESYIKNGIYFFYENVNLIDQLFIRNKLPLTHLVWKRDGSGLGGGSVYHSFLYNLANKTNTKFFFIFSFYLDEKHPVITPDRYKLENIPVELRDDMGDDFDYSLIKTRRAHWGEDTVNYYKRIDKDVE